MAISKERLEELIKQGATIYEAKYGNINPVSLKQKIRWVHNNMITFEPSMTEKYQNHKYFNRLFETKEEAQEYLEFGNVTRTEKLILPNWNEFSKCDKSVKFFKDNTKYSMYVFVKNKNTNNCRIIIYADDNEQDWIVFEKPLTEENYYDARKLCVKLFKGESE